MAFMFCQECVIVMGIRIVWGMKTKVVLRGSKIMWKGGYGHGLKVVLCKVYVSFLGVTIV